MKTHLNLATKDIEKSVEFYSTLLDAKPTKILGDHALFITEQPGLELALDLAKDVSPARDAHCGVYVESTDDVERAIVRLERAGLVSSIEREDTCCYANQIKVWATDPEGRRWEVYTVHEDTEDRDNDATTCCGGPAPAGTDACCVKDADAKAAGESGCGCTSRQLPRTLQSSMSLSRRAVAEALGSAFLLAGVVGSGIMAERLSNGNTDDFDVESAGLEPGELDPLAVAVMDEIGIDISHNRTKSAFDLFKAGRFFGYVITVCDETSAERCPIFPGVTQRLHWSFADPAAFEGSWTQRLALARIVRDQIRDRVATWCQEVCAAPTA